MSCDTPYEAKGPMTVAYSESPRSASFSISREQFESMARHLESLVAFGMKHDELEAYVIEQGRELERRLLQEHLDLRAGAERPVRVVKQGGAELRERRRSARLLRSLVGEVVVTRLLYQAAGTDGLCPQDASLNLPAESFSLGVRRRVAEEAASGSFEHAVERVAATTGAHVAKRQSEQLARRAAVDFESFYTDRVMDVIDETELLLVLSFDAAGIVMRTEDLRPATRKAAEIRADDPCWPPKRLSPGQKRNRKRMAQVAAIYAIERNERQPQDIVRELRPVQDTAPKKPRPKPVNKRVSASVENEPAVVIDAYFQEALRRDPHQLRQWVVLVDGNEHQLELVRAAAHKHEVQVTVVLDLIHVLEYLWRAAHCFYSAGTTEAEKWVATRLLMLLEGVDASTVAGGIRRSATLQQLENRDGVDVCADYLTKYRDLTRYADALRAGLPIATGVIEGACRYIVRDRMDKTGARWSVAGAEAVLKLRALRTNGDFDAYWQHHVAAEYRRNHACRYADSQVPSPLPTKRHLRRIK
jgi:hypothetical protein